MTISRMSPSGIAPILCFLALSACGRTPDSAGSVPASRAGRDARVVSLVPSVTQIIFELGAGDQLVGATRYCERPEAARRVPRVGGILDVSVEAVARQRPDIVIGSPIVLSGRLVEILEPAGVRFLPLNFEDFDDVRNGMIAIGEALGRSSEAASMVSDFNRDLAALDMGTRRTRALFVVGTRPLVVAGPSSFQGQLMSAMGLDNVVDSEGAGFPTWSLEQVIKANPEVIIDGIVGGEPSAAILSEAGIAAPVVHIPDDAILLPGPGAVRAAAALARRIRELPGPEAE